MGMIGDLITLLLVGGIIYIVVTGYITGDVSLGVLALAVLLLAPLFFKDTMSDIFFWLVNITGTPIQSVLARHGIFTSKLVAGMIGGFIVIVGSILFFDWVDPLKNRNSPIGKGSTADRTSPFKRHLPDGLVSYPTGMRELNDSGYFDFVTTATPASIIEKEDGEVLIRDLLLADENTLFAVAYEDGKGWKIVREANLDNYREAMDAVVNYRGYEIDDEDWEPLEDRYELYVGKSEI